MTIKERYRKERRRIQSFLSKASKRGYIWEQNPLPAIPKRITEASVRRLLKLSPDALYKKAAGWVDLTTGEFFSALEGRKEERRRAVKKGIETKQLNKLRPKHDKKKKASQDDLERMQRQSEEGVDRAYKAVENLIALIEGIPADSDYSEDNKKELLGLIRGVSITDAFADKIESNWERLVDLAYTVIMSSDDLIVGEGLSVFEHILFS